VVVARAYLDQLTRSKSLQPERVTAITRALQRAEKMHSAKDSGAAAAVGELDTQATQLESDAAAASDRDAARLKALAATLKGSSARLR
jgi:hypothetical protein